jgi:F-type H+-transporting ATPase subunit delta
MTDSTQQPSEATKMPTDTGAVRLAKVYAQAIVEAADRKHCRADVLAELGSIVRDVLRQVPAATAVFASPRVTPEEKGAMIDKICGGKVLPTTLHALHVLARHGRLGMLSEVVSAAELLADELDGRRQAIFTTAVPLEKQDQDRIVAETGKALNASLAPTFIVNPAVLGGLVVRVEDTVYDHSVATSLARLGDRLKQRSIHEIQYRRDRLGTA